MAASERWGNKILNQMESIPGWRELSEILILYIYFDMKYTYIIETGCILYEWADKIQSFLFFLWEEGVNNITKIQFKIFRFLFNVEMSKMWSMMCIVKQISIYILNIQALLKPECVQYARICARKSPYLINIGRLHPTS